MSARTSACRISIILISMTLAGCVIPLSARDADSRQNIDDKVPDFIVVGKTTRADVLLTLGEPDHASDNGLWFTYTRTSREGGLLFLVSGQGGPTSEKMVSRRVIVTFDASGVVTSAKYERLPWTAREIGVGPSVSRGPWAAGGYLFPTDSSGVSEDGGTITGKAFAPALWHKGIRGWTELRAFHLAPPEPPAIEGSLFVADNAVFFFSPNADNKSKPLFKLAYADIADVYIDNFVGNRRLVVKRTDGSYESFTVLQREGAPNADATSTENAGALVRSRWQSAATR